MSSPVTLEAAGMPCRCHGSRGAGSPPSHTNSALGSQGPRWFTPELVQVSSSCGMPLPFSSAGGKIPVECLAMVPAYNCIFCFCF